MQILQVGTGFAPIPPRGASGTERTIHFLSVALAALEHEVTVLDIVTEDRAPTPYQLAEVPLRWQKDINLMTHILRGFSFRLASGRGLKDLLSKNNFDIINFHNQFSAHHIDLAHQYNIPTVYSLHNALWYNDWACRSQWQRLKFFQDIRAMQKADAIICFNNATRSNLARYFGIAPNKIAVISNGIDEKWLTNGEVSEEIKTQYTPSNEPIVLNVGRIAPYKNQLTLAQAIPLVVQKIPEVRFLFIGPIADRSYFHKVQRAIADAEVGNHISFLGEISYVELPEFYSLCKVFVCPSASEGMPTVILEAMAKGKPVVASDIEPFREALPEGVGITVPTFDHEALAKVIINLLKNEQLRKEMGQRAKEHVRLNYTWQNVARITAQVYQGVI
ncbi:Glycogen synthase [subsurface metagenome]|nr:glycosyltransferase [Dehalococcoidia bacterium]